MLPDERKYIYVIAEGYTSRRVVLVIKKNEIRRNFNIELAQGGEVTGIITDEEGRPVAGAAVRTSPFTNHPVTTTKTVNFTSPDWTPHTTSCIHCS